MSWKLGDVLRDKPEMLERKDRCPTGKTVFHTKREAREALKRMKNHRTAMKEFRCGFCESGTWATDAGRSRSNRLDVNVRT